MKHVFINSKIPDINVQKQNKQHVAVFFFFVSNFRQFFGSWTNLIRMKHQIKTKKKSKISYRYEYFLKKR